MKILLRENTITSNIGYHVTPLKNISDIRESGLIIKKYTGYISGVKQNYLSKNYFWLEYDYAEWFAEDHANSNLRDNPTDEIILKVNLKGITLYPDPEAEDMNRWGAEDNEGRVVAVYTTEAIEPERIIDEVEIIYKGYY
jgi:hypothetical protein